MPSRDEIDAKQNDDRLPLTIYRWPLDKSLTLGIVQASLSLLSLTRDFDRWPFNVDRWPFNVKLPTSYEQATSEGTASLYWLPVA